MTDETQPAEPVKPVVMFGDSRPPEEVLAEGNVRYLAVGQRRFVSSEEAHVLERIGEDVVVRFRDITHLAHGEGVIHTARVAMQTLDAAQRASLMDALIEENKENGLW